MIDLYALFPNSSFGMRNFIVLFLLFSELTLAAQTTWQGTVNTYHEVTTIDPCGTIGLGDVSGLEVGQPVLLLQAKGATIQANNNENFGMVTNLNRTGAYEVGRIAEILANTVRLENRLVRTYDIGGSVQLVGGAEAADATIVGTLTADPWNGSTGGVVYLEVANTLQVMADIDVSGQGFRGGLRQLTNNNCNGATFANDFFYPSGNWRGAAKGEGIAAFIAGKEWGRGPQANGGGGGNDHNSGGGGGASSFAGGLGGEATPPSVFGCKGLFPGEPGWPQAVDAERLFFGGGGGAGHVNNNTANAVAGHGGGIVLVRAGTLTGTGSILAEGLTPTTIVGDGGSGGGAGGTVYLLADTFEPLNVSVRGGSGGSVQNSGRCLGPGGGGAGGVLYDNSVGNPLTASVAGGSAGTNSTTANCSGPQNGATAGQAGIHLVGAPDWPGGTLSSATVMITPTNAPQLSYCDGDTLCLGVAPNVGVLASVDWFFAVPGEPTASPVNQLPGAFTPEMGVLKVVVSASTPAELIFEAMAMADCYTSSSIPVATATRTATSAATFSVATDDLQLQLNLDDPTGIDSVSWNFGDGSPLATGEAVIHLYDEAGTYTVTATAFGPCGAVTSSQSVTLVAPSLPPVASFTADMQAGCAPLTVQFFAEENNVQTYAWTFEGGDPATSTISAPTVIYDAAGSYPVRLVVANAIGSDSLVQTSYIVVDDVPMAAFTVDVSGNTVAITNGATGAESYLYEFGDGNSSSQASPTYTYGNGGTVTITQTVTNACGSSTTTQTVQLGSPPVATFESSTGGGCAPTLVTFTDLSTGEVEARTWSFPGGSPTTATDSVVNVLYDAPGRYGVSLTVENGLGESTSTLADSLDIRPFPTAAFDFATDQLSVAFQNSSTDGDDYLWDFGDGNSSTAFEPVHTYAAPGLYDVTLTVSNPFCAAAQTLPALVETTSTRERDGFGRVGIRPNPFTDELFVQLDHVPVGSQMRVIDARGKVIFWGPVESHRQRIHLPNLPAGLYFIALNSASGSYVERLVRE